MSADGEPNRMNWLQATGIRKYFAALPVILRFIQMRVETKPVFA